MKSGRVTLGRSIPIAPFEQKGSCDSSMLWKNLMRPALFRMQAESAHHWTMSTYSSLAGLPPLGTCVSACCQVRDPRLEVKLFGLQFPNPVGLAAGFDKNAQWFNQLARLGFGSIEVGTITRLAQPGNPKPRLFRLSADRALINRMGFNNDGAQAVADRLKHTRISPILGINIGLTKVTPLDLASDDYRGSFELLFPYAAYFTVNVSSPNTPGLRSLQDREPLSRLLHSLRELNDQLASQHQQSPRPILLKIAPDLTNAALDDVLAMASEQRIAGLIATNTTISREGLTTPRATIESIGNGGLSGRPLTERSRQVVRYLYEQSQGTMPIVGVGGLMNGDDVCEMMRSGASLVQTYTGFIYGGPRFVHNVLKTLQKRLDEAGVDSISQIVGTATAIGR